MHKGIYQNSYIIALISFIVLCVVFYLFQIGTTVTLENGRVEKKINWKYPLAISLVIWLFWHFYMYPPPDQENIMSGGSSRNKLKNTSDVPDMKNIGKYNKIMNQKINMHNWN